MTLRFFSGFLLLALLNAGCDSRPAAPALPAVLVVSGDTAGWITPCGCTSNQSGGLLRRGTHLTGLRTAHQVIYADAGGAAAGTSAFQRVKFEAILKGEMKMGIAAHNLGGSEAALEPDYLRELGRRLSAPLISANARDASGRSIAAPMVIVPAAGRRMMVVGVISPRYATPQIKMDDPRQAVLDTVAQTKGKFDSLVVLAYCPDEELQQLAASLPEADAVIGGPTGQAMAPKQIGPTLLASATNKGKFLVQLDVPQTGAWSGKVVEMGPTIADQDSQKENLHEYLAELEVRDFLSTETGLVPAIANSPSDYRIAGSAACASCHKDDHAKWLASKHAAAWETLRSRGLQVNPDCQQCHTTGYGLPGGFISSKTSAAFVAVGCENCHGPSAAHAKQPKTHTPFAAFDQCVRCHDHENSPAFNAATYWERIRHEPNRHVERSETTPRTIANEHPRALEMFSQFVSQDPSLLLRMTSLGERGEDLP